MMAIWKGDRESRKWASNDRESNDRDSGGSGEPGASKGRRHWSTPLLMAGSALLGASAVAIWNWRTIVSLQNELASQSSRQAEARGEEQGEEPGEEPGGMAREADNDEIF